MMQEIFCYTDFEDNSLDFYILEEELELRKPEERIYRGIRVGQNNIQPVSLKVIYPFPNFFEKVWFHEDKEEFIKRVNKLCKGISYYYTDIDELLTIIQEQ